MPAVEEFAKALKSGGGGEGAVAAPAAADAAPAAASAPASAPAQASGQFCVGFVVFCCCCGACFVGGYLCGCLVLSFFVSCWFGRLCMWLGRVVSCEGAWDGGVLASSSAGG